MSERQTQAQTEELKLLRAVINGTLPEYLEQNTTDLAHDIARELHDDGMFTGKRFAPIAGRASYVGAKVASRGRDRLAELEQLAALPRSLDRLAVQLPANQSVNHGPAS